MSGFLLISDLIKELQNTQEKYGDVRMLVHIRDFAHIDRDGNYVTSSISWLLDNEAAIWYM